MADLSVDDILALDDRETFPIDVPEWGGTVQVRPISARLRWQFETAVMKGRDTGDYTEMAEASLDIVCEALGVGQRERDKIGRKSGAALERIRDAALQRAGYDKRAVEDAAEDFGDAPTSGSDTD